MIFYCYHGGIVWEKRINASPYGAGGLASRKPEKNKAIEKPFLKLLFILLLFFYPSYGTKPPRQDGAERPIMVGQE